MANANPGRRWRRLVRSLARSLARAGGVLLAVLFALAVVVVVGQRVWVGSGDRSEVVGERLAEGVSYDRVVWSEPRPVVIHVVTVDLKVEGVEIEIGAVYGDDGRVAARTTSDYVRDSGLTVGINGSFFYPFEENPPWSPYPGDGDLVTPLGFVVDDGVVHGSAWQDATFSLVDGAEAEAGDGLVFHAVVGELAEGAQVAISGASALVIDGVPGVFDGPSDRPGGGDAAYARTVIAANNERGLVYLVVVDGKQPGYSEGLTLTELAAFLVEELAATDAVELDGGGSSTMVAGVDAAGGFRRLSRPINSRIPERERVVATHVGVRVG